MKQFAALMVCMVVVTGCAALRGGASDSRTVSVTGTVETEVAPDSVVWSVRLTDTDKDLSKAKAKSDAKIEAVVALREKLGVADGDFSTGRLDIRRVYERDERGRSGDFKHFAVTRNVTIRQRELERFDEYLDTLVGAADMEVDFRYDSSMLADARAEARLEAVRIAREKAAAMARAAGAELGRALSIDEHSQGGAFRFGGAYRSANFSMQGGDPATDARSKRFVPGAMDVKVTVYATFELE